MIGTDMLALLGQPAFRCLGEFQLKGLDTPETLYEVWFIFIFLDLYYLLFFN